jgi:pimeloyl-ACP methyl ester carboxylesterase
MFAKLATAIDGNPALERRNRFSRMTIAVVSGADTWTVRTGGKQIHVAKGAPEQPTIELAASPEAWARFARTIPEPGYQALNAMARCGHLTVGGDLLEYGRHLMLLEELFARLRGPAPSTKAPAEVGTPRFENVTGRYVHLDIAGRPHRLYFEEAGPAGGIPLICLHTAGSDGRQFRAVLNDPEVTKQFRVLAFDLPCHGKSSPPPGYERTLYALTTDLYMATVRAFSAALDLDQKPVVMGCSIGGRAVLHLAHRHGAEFRAAIGLQSALYAERGGTPSYHELEILHRPDVNGGDVSAASVLCLMSPTSPPEHRAETLWHYAQGGPGIFAGDLVYYFPDGDMRNVDLAPLAAQTCPVYLLTGEYDVSATPEMTADLARKINARHFEVMRGMGHFPMSENPDAFLGYLRPVLDAIRTST